MPDGRTIRSGRVFRSDVLYRLTESDVELLRSLSIRTVIDLRSRDEVLRYPQSSIDVAGLQNIHVPIEVDLYSETGSLSEDYQLLLRGAGKGFREVIGHLAHDPYPVVINCFAGKDRTGLASALILGALGVADDVIVADYALSEPHMWRLMDLHQSTLPARGESGLLPNWLEAAAATMEETLHVISAEWGSVDGYLASIGISTAEVQLIRTNLTV